MCVHVRVQYVNVERQKAAVVESMSTHAHTLNAHATHNTHNAHYTHAHAHIVNLLVPVWLCKEVRNYTHGHTEAKQGKHKASYRVVQPRPALLEKSGRS